MKVIIQIPSYNEEQTLGNTIRELPRRIPQVDRVELLVVDDGSEDRTAKVAKEAGADHVVRHTRNKGLAAAFQTGIDNAVSLGADIIVNTDADNQYSSTYIPSLIAPILNGTADIVIGDRRIQGLQHLPWHHRILQRLGSAVVGWISDTHVPDAPSGFRALSREAAMQLEVLTTFTYTLETIVQASTKGMRVLWIPIDVNMPTRESRLKRSEWHYVSRSAMSILRLYALYKPLKAFSLLALPFAIAGGGLWLRYLWLMVNQRTGGGAHVQSVVVGAALLLIAFMLGNLGLLGELIARNRLLSERALYTSKRSLHQAIGPSHAPVTDAKV